MPPATLYRNILEVNLGVEVTIRRLGFTDITLAGGEEQWVRIENIEGSLYIDHSLVKLHLSKHQDENCCLKGTELKKELAQYNNVHPNIMVALHNNRNMIPVSWAEKSVDVFFWGGSATENGSTGVPYIEFTKRGTVLGIRKLIAGWDSRRLAAITE